MDDVLEALSYLKEGKSDGDRVFAEDLLFASSALISPLADFFSSLVCHGFIPQCLRDCVLIPVPKKNKDVSCSSNYRPIALASSLSKLLSISSSSTIQPSYTLVHFSLGLNLVILTTLFT